ncbi:helix-turn-helix domain-containing protein [Sutcliffiella deserti]|uniref:helix-turn-helix domain-containing protein n=1 Tax=Sutcliffiella deserti TaxID=2875501 RepID=UPI001CBF6C60|nr:helix-turn-helix domain-containing protein [Sutcliffiella deserti]
MKSLEYLCLHCIHAFRGERTISAIYHLFKGKKSSQTIQDGNLFSVSFLFGILPDLTRPQLEKIIILLEKEKFIIADSNNYYSITSTGEKVLAKGREEYPFSQYLNGWLYKGKAEIFWKRYSLLIQTLSNLQKEKTDFLPIQYEESIQHTVKNMVLNQGISKQQFAGLLYDETYRILKKVPEHQAYIFVAQLSGHLHAGLTVRQISKKLRLDETWVKVEFQSVLHFFLQVMVSEALLFPIINRLCNDIINRPNITSTTQKSLYFLKQGYTLQEIAAIRKLKESTIEDHIVELALNVQDFSLSPYIDEENMQLIQHAVSELKTNQLKRIKDYLGDAKISYFQIRLVLSKMGDRHEPRASIKK